MAVCANGAVIYDPSTDRIVSARTLSADAARASSPRSPPASSPAPGLAVERVGRSAHDAATPQFVSSPGYEHAWLNPDNTEVSIEDLLSAPAVKLLIRKAGARSADMAAALAKYVGLQGDITYSTNNGLIEIVPLGISKATGIAELAGPVGHHRAKTWWPSATCPTTCRCCTGPASVWRWATRIPMRWPRPTRSPRPNTDDGVARVLERWWLVSTLGLIGGVNRSSWIGGLDRTAISAARWDAVDDAGDRARSRGRSSACRAGSSARSIAAPGSRRWSAGRAHRARSPATPTPCRSRR